MNYSLTINNMTEEDLQDVTARLNLAVGQTPEFVASAGIAPPLVSPDSGVMTILPDTQPISVLSETKVDYIDPNAELDAKGLPWDERIHAGTKTKTAKGVWKKRKGVQPAEFDAVIEELKEAMGETPVVPAAEEEPEIEIQRAEPAPVEIHASDVPVSVVTTDPAVVAVPPPPAAALPPVAPQAEVAAPAQIRDYANLMQRITVLLQAGDVAPDYVFSVIKRVNDHFATEYKAITDIGGDIEHVNYAWSCLDIDGKSK